jgi:hypothetical protein
MIRFFSGIGMAVLATASSLFAATGDGTPADSNIQYIGRWDKSVDSQYVNYWGGAYIKTGFTGTTVKVKLGGTVNLFVGIDSTADKLYGNAGGILNLTTVPLQNKTHSLRVTPQNQDDKIKFKGLVLDAGARTVALPARPIIEFIGNSITSGATTSKGMTSAFPWLTGEALSCDHTQISIGGITLVNGYYFTYSGAPTVGMSVSYFKQRTPPNYPSTDNSQNPDWDFSRYTPRLVFVNLGTNDANTTACKSGNSNPCVTIPTDTFTSVYTKFLRNIRAKYPLAEIFALRTFGGHLISATQAAVTAINAAGDLKVHYVNTAGWLVASDYNSDGIHPSDAGHKKATDQLVPILRPYLAVPAAVVSGFLKRNQVRFSARYHKNNPGELLIECNNGEWRNQTATVALYNVQGRRLFAKHVGLQDRFVVETPAFPAGLYLVTIGDQQAPKPLQLQ